MDVKDATYHTKIDPSGILISGTPGNEIILDGDIGRVGIGTNAPTDKLDVNGSIRANAGILTSLVGGYSSALPIKIGGTWNSTSDNSSHKMQATANFYIDSSSTGSIMLNYWNNKNIILGYGGGKVGIGTNEPTTNLHVLGSIRQSNAGVQSLYLGTDTPESTDQCYIKTDAPGNLHISSGTGDNILLNCDYAGGVKIGGTGTAGTMLTVDGDVRVINGGRIEMLRPSANYIDFYPGGSFCLRGYDGSANTYNTTNGEGVFLTCKTNGYVEIPKLKVEGVEVTGSDDRIKHNEVDISGSLATINKIFTKHYLKTFEIYEADTQLAFDASGNVLDPSGNIMVNGIDFNYESGIIAQELRNIPELAFCVKGEEYRDDIVTIYEKDLSDNFVLDSSGNQIATGTETTRVKTTLGVDYNSIFTTHIQATQELSRKNDALEADNGRLKTRMEALESAVIVLQNK